MTDDIGHAVSDAHVAKMREMLARRWGICSRGGTVVEPVGRPVEGGVVVFAFDIIDGRARNAVPCGRLFYDAELATEWGHPDSGGAGQEVPFLFLLVRRRGRA